MMAQLTQFIVAALFINTLSYCSAENVYCVTPTATSCSSCPHNSANCTTLSEYAQEAELYFTSNTTMVFLLGEHLLDTDITVANITRLTMSGESTSGSVPTVICNGSVGFFFGSLEYLKVSSLAFTFCSRTYDSFTEILSKFLHGRDDDHHFKFALGLEFAQHVELVNCSFHDNFGTALAMDNAYITIRDNNDFLRNHCTGSNACALGGGIAAIDSHLTFIGNTTFLGNNASFAGAGIALANSTLFSTGNIHFTNNSNFGNITIYGVIYSAGTIWASASTLHFTGTNNFINNSAKSALGADGGAIFAKDNTSLSFTGVSHFIQNSADAGGAIYASNSSILNISGTSYFSNNHALRGGAIFSNGNTTLIFDGNISFTTNGHEVNTIGDSYGGGIYLALMSIVSFLPNTTVYWENNHATFGGAIYVLDVNPYIYCAQFGILHEKGKCFFQLPGQNLSNGLDVQLVFNRNSADEAGSVLFGGAIDNCKLTGLDSYSSGDIFDILVDIETDNTTSSISSRPLSICPCENNHTECNKSSITRSVYRGETFEVTVIGFGQRNGTVSAQIRSLLKAVDTSHLNSIQYNQKTNTSCTTLNYTMFSPSNLVLLEMYADGPCSTFGDNLIVQLNINQTCPPGFNLSASESSCICDQRLENYTNLCNITNGVGRITRKESQNFWVGYNQVDGLILHPHCPIDYCVSYTVEILLDNTDIQCANDRSGLLCGSCKKGYSLLLGTSKCSKCDNNYLALLIPFALMGVALVSLLFICKLTVAEGTLSGLVFYANIVKTVSTPVECPDPLSIFIAWLNLDFGIEACFFDEMDAYSKTWLQFAFPVYIWVLVGLIILVSNFSRRFANLLGNNPVSVLATLILLSYTKILNTLVTAVNVTNLEYPKYNRVVWLYDANIDYLVGRHIALFLVAVFVFFIFFLPYTLLLLLFQWLQVISHLRLFTWVNSAKLKSFMDAYHAPYKPKHRYWPGLLLVLRCVLLFVLAFNPQSDLYINLLAILVETGMLTVWAWVSGGVYRSWCLDALEASFTLNLIILSGATYYVHLSEGNLCVVRYTSVSIALVTFVGILAYHIFQQVSNTKLWKKIPELKFCRPTIKHAIKEHENNREIADFTQPREPLLATQSRDYGVV